MFSCQRENQFHCHNALLFHSDTTITASIQLQWHCDTDFFTTSAGAEIALHIHVRVKLIVQYCSSFFESSLNYLWQHYYHRFRFSAFIFSLSQLHPIKSNKFHLAELDWLCQIMIQFDTLKMLLWTLFSALEENVQPFRNRLTEMFKT